MTENFPEPKIATDEEFEVFKEACSKDEGFDKKFDKNGITVWSKVRNSFYFVPKLSFKLFFFSFRTLGN